MAPYITLIGESALINELVTLIKQCGLRVRIEQSDDRTVLTFGKQIIDKWATIATFLQQHIK